MPPCIVGAREGGGRKRRFLDLDAELLVKLAHKGGLGTLVLLDLAAGKFPQAGHGAAGRPLLKKDAAVPADERRGHHRQCRNFFQKKARR